MSKRKYYLTDEFFGTPDVEIPGYFYWAVVGTLWGMAIFVACFSVWVLIIATGSL